MRRRGRAAWAMAVAGVAFSITFAAVSGARAVSGKPPVHPAARAAGHKADKSTVPKISPRTRAHRRARMATGAPAGSGVLAVAGCFGRFIAWRDELSGLMLQANSFTPWPDDRIRFDRIERTFAAVARRDRKLMLTLQPTFREADFPPDVRRAFQAGQTAAAAAFADHGYRLTQITVVGQPDLSPQQRMAQLEANADQAFAPLAAPCERPAGH